MLEGLEGARAYRATSLSTPVGTATTTELADTLDADDQDFELVELPVALAPALATPPEPERRILTLRFYDNLTQAQIAEEVGVSQMHVSRLITKALASLRGHPADDGR